MNIRQSTIRYEAWLGRQIRLLKGDLLLKHQRMRADPFFFLRATYYRWAQVWPQACPKFCEGPRVLSVGDLHVENFGTWRDAEGRLVWGVNDFDEASPLPYTNDLIRLAASAFLAVEQLDVSPEDAAAEILRGYQDAVKVGGAPFVLVDRGTALRAMVRHRLREPEKFWKKLRRLAPLKTRLPSTVLPAIRSILPDQKIQLRFAHRIAGLGSLGRERYTGLAVWQGGWLAREAKAWALSACLFAEGKTAGPLYLEDILRRAGFAGGEFQTLLIGSGPVDGILNDPRVVAATLTGSEQAGIQVGVSAAKRIKKVVLELGGSDPFIVMPSADLDAAAATAVEARIQNNGQSCIAAKRFIVSGKIADEFERKFVKRMQDLRVGDPLEESTQLGPLANADAVTSLDADVKKTVAAGARVLTGGHTLDRPGNFYAPTVLTDIPKDSPAYKEEFFGPVASIFRVKDVDRAIQIANDSRFGLGASAWTNDPAETERFINELEAGMVFLNKMVASDPRLPFGGVKHSGHGRELAEHGIREFVNIKTVWIQ